MAKNFKNTFLTNKDAIFQSVFFQTLAAARLDAVWPELENIARGEPTPLDREMSSELNRKGGAIIIPRGYIYADVDEKKITLTPYKKLSKDVFQTIVSEALNQDCATLLGHKGYATNIHLPAEFLSSVARQSIKDLHLGRKHTELIDSERVSNFASDDFARSYCPMYMGTPFGSRTKVGALLAAVLSVKQIYFEKICRKYRIQHEELREAEGIFNEAQLPIVLFFLRMHSSATENGIEQPI